MRWEGHVTRVEGNEKAFKTLFCKITRRGNNNAEKEIKGQSVRGLPLSDSFTFG
jgi:hypothetical protein